METLKENITAYKQYYWIHKKWMSSPAFIDKSSGSIKLYDGQKYDPDYFEFERKVWDHDHCEICTYGC